MPTLKKIERMQRTLADLMRDVSEMKEEAIAAKPVRRPTLYEQLKQNAISGRVRKPEAFKKKKGQQ